jgi:hypothetical protein
LRFHSPKFLFAFLICLGCASASLAIPLAEYHARVRSALGALDTILERDQDESYTAGVKRASDSVARIKTILPLTLEVEWDKTTFSVDNSEFHKSLDAFPNASSEQPILLDRMIERLQAIDDRLTEIEQAHAVTTQQKTESSTRLAAILKRPEYAKTQESTSAFTRLWIKFWKWIESLMPKPKPLAPGKANFVSLIAQIFVILLAVAAIVYVVRLFAPRFLNRRRAKKKAKPEARIVLGERLEPDQTAIDLLAEAEALARRGELRAAIRKAYIALLVELGERKVISLAQHKTNRDYLSSVKHITPLYQSVIKLTDSFERHWYGFARASEEDWLAFRAGYAKALQRQI